MNSAGFLLGAALVLYTWNAYRSGVLFTGRPGTRVRRDTKPGDFYFWVALRVFAGLLMIAGSVWGLMISN